MAALLSAIDGLVEDRRLVLHRRIRLFVAATISYNIVEAVVAITAGTAASSVALIGFGLDSIIEVTSAAAVAWQFAGRDPQTRERTALRIIAWSFFALAAYVSIDAVLALVDGNHARHSTVGLVLAALSLVIMPLLSFGQRRTGRELNSRSAVADSKQTLLCTYLSAVLLVGLALNLLLGWSFADPIAALIIAAVAVREGREAWKGDSCCAPNASLQTASIDDAAGDGDESCCAPGAPADAVIAQGARCSDGCACCGPSEEVQGFTLNTRGEDRG